MTGYVVVRTEQFLPFSWKDTSKMVALLKYQAFCHRVLKLIGFKLYMVITSTELYLFMLLVVDTDCDRSVLLESLLLNSLERITC